MIFRQTSFAKPPFYLMDIFKVVGTYEIITG